MKRLRRFFFPPENSSLFRRVFPYFSIGVGIFLILLAIPPTWEYSNSPSFCGTTCHTMPPNYNTYLESPHARVTCVDCHIGRDLIIRQLVRKSGHSRLVAATILDNYELPIKAGSMSPARETCEQCHFPEKFSDDSLRQINHFDNNRTNDPYSIYLIMRTGGGSQREGLGYGIHWHIENKVTYIALDEDEQEIPWVRVKTASGETIEYNAVNSPIDTDNLDQYTLHEMDCITCHNRIAHLIDTPTNAVDNALHQGNISTDIPFIRVRAIELLSVSYASNEFADHAFETLNQYYADNYSEFYADGADQIEQAVETLKELYNLLYYPEEVLDWQTHTNNIGHLDSPGCFRCHDGQHFSETGEVVRLECNLCHSIPRVVRPNEIEPSIPIATGLEPASHLDSTWITRHRNEFDVTCANCHTTSNAGGTDDSSFCSNSMCHGTGWEHAGFDAPGLATIMGIYQVEPEPLLEDFEGDPTYQILQPLFLQQCGGCHGPVPSNGLRVTDYKSLISGGNNGLVVISGSPENSLVLKVLSDGHFAQLTDHQMLLLTQWIDDGLPEE